MDAKRLSETFDGVEPFTIGIEEEVMLLDPATLDLATCAPVVLELLGGRRTDVSFKPELPASQIELVTAPRRSVPAAIGALALAREALLAAAGGLARPAAAGAHPFSAAEGALSVGAHYERAAGEYGWAARRQLICALQVHVAVGGAERTLGVYNALRAELPALAALAANAPLHEGRDTGLHSARPLISGLLPRQGIPPPLASWEELADALRWGARAGAFSEPSFWWWELRPHPRFGTLEVRVPDAQTTIADAAAVAALVHALVVDLAERHDAGGLGPPAPSWRIAENRWFACRHGTEGTLADLDSGEPVPAREHLRALIDRLEPVAERIGAGEPLRRARELASRGGASRQRRIAAERGPRGLAEWLADRFGDGLARERDADRFAAGPARGRGCAATARVSG